MADVCAILMDIVRSRDLADRTDAQRRFETVLAEAAEGLGLIAAPCAAVGDEFQALAPAFPEALTLILRIQLLLPEECKDFCRRAGIPFTETTDFTPEVIRSIDVLYMTRVQRERFIDLEEYERVKNVYVLTASMLEGCREHLRILHPLPRVGEIVQDVDDTPYAYYVEQAQGGLYVRQSILCEVLGLEVND